MRTLPQISEDGDSTKGPNEYARTKMERTSWSCTPSGMWRLLPILLRAGAAIEEDIGEIKAKRETIIVVLLIF